MEKPANKPDTLPENYTPEPTERGVDNKDVFEIQDRESLSEEIIAIISNLDEMIATNETSEFPLFPRQIESLQKIRDFLSEGRSLGYLKLPTGVGKTVIFAKLIEAFTKENDKKAVVCSPTKIIAGQNVDTVEKVGNTEVAKYFGGKKEIDGNILSTTYSSLRRKHKVGGFEDGNIDLVILDEAHRALGQATREAVLNYAINKAIVLGFTASPEFYDEKKVGDLLPYEIDSMDVKEAIEQGILCALRVYLIKTETDLRDVPVVAGEYDQKALSLKINSPKRNELVASGTKDVILDKDISRKTLVYCADIAHAVDMANEYITQGIRAEYISGDMSDDEKEAVLKRFENGTTKVLCNAELLIEGFNDQEVNLIINAVPTLSKVVAEQRGGRALRPNPNDPDKVAIVIDTVEESQRVSPILYADIVGGADIQGIKIDIEDKDGKVHEKKPLNKVLMTDPELIMEVVNKRRQEFKNLMENAPVGYVSVSSLIDSLGLNKVEVQLAIKEVAPRLKDQGRKFLDKSGEVDNFISMSVAGNLIRKLKPEYSKHVTLSDVSERYQLSANESLRVLIHISDEIGIDPLNVLGVLMFSPDVYQELEKVESDVGIYQYLAKISGEVDGVSDMEMDKKVPIDPDTLSREDDIRFDVEYIKKSDPEFWEFMDNLLEGKDSLGNLEYIGLDEREALVLNMRLNEISLREIGLKFGVTYNQIANVENGALRKIRNMYKKIFEGNGLVTFYALDSRASESGKDYLLGEKIYSSISEGYENMVNELRLICLAIKKGDKMPTLENAKGIINRINRIGYHNTWRYEWVIKQMNYYVNNYEALEEAVNSDNLIKIENIQDKKEFIDRNFDLYNSYLNFIHNFTQGEFDLDKHSN